MSGETRRRTTNGVIVRLLALALLTAAFPFLGCSVHRDGPGLTPEHPPPPRGEVADPWAARSAPSAERQAPQGEGVTNPEGTGGPAVADQPAVEPDPGGQPEVGEPFAGESVSASPLDELAEVEPVFPGEAQGLSPELLSLTPTFDIPIEINEAVLAWVDRYTNDSRKVCEATLQRSGRYLGMFREIFASEGLPQDLVYMAHVESGYKTSAYSRAHARGVFQFIASTARRYGLRVDDWVDERADPEKSARASARYMRDLYAEFGDWYLSMAAYNAGEGKIRRAIERTGDRDFWSIARTRHIRRETKNHIPAILAAILISKEPGKYGFAVVPDPEVEYDTISVAGAADLRVIARCAGTDLETIQALNPALRRGQTPPDGSFDVHVPSGSGATASLALAEIPPGERVLYTRHLVRSGDTLSAIGRRYGVSVASIQEVNKLGRRTLIHVNQTLLVPTSAASRLNYGAGGNASETIAGEPLSYRVRRGDNLSAIARRYSTTASAIAAANGIPVDKLLKVGERLTVVPGVRAAAEARARAGHDGASVAQQTKVVHTVRRGDTLSLIASLYRTSVSALCSLNGMSPSATLYPGARLTVGYR